MTSIEAFLQKVVSKQFLQERTFLLQTGETFSKEALIERLYQGGYEVVGSVTQPGELAFRGGIVDLYPPTSPRPIRIEFFGDEIESIRTFDAESQKSIGPAESVEVILGRENLFDPNFYRISLTEYLSPHTLLVIDEPDEVIQKGKRFVEEVEEGSLFAARRNPKYPKVDELYLPLAFLADAGSGRTTVDLESLSLRPERGAKRFAFDIRSLPSLGLGRPGQPFSEVVSTLDILRRDHLVLVTVRNETQLARFKHLFSDHDLPWAMWNPEQGPAAAFPTPIYLTVGTVTEGFSIPETKIAFLTEEALTGRSGAATQTRRRATTRDGKAKEARAGFLSSFEDLKPLDYVVHLDHGIGRYIGLKRLSIRQQERAPAYDSDFLVLEYAGKDKVYVPLNSLHLVQRYVGLEGHPPRVDSLGGTQWAKTKSKVQGDVQRMAEDLLQLYAEREVVQGHPFATPPSLSEEFAAAFEYEETPDQARAIADVLADMERPKPMDRLVCGDVGFGKTEVALRAAFVAVMGGKQVAVLVPTTLLAQQHYQTFSNRFADWPVRVELL
ncbi:MAG: DEAD/DEAH box helicase [Candidatus Manganitrophus sp.]|nr:MAG: DEAD/DEAH box helicase [Candidatus Manganitrophus sp.]